MSDIPASLYRKGRATQVNIEALQELIAERDAAMESVEAQLDALNGWPVASSVAVWPVKFCQRITAMST